jgi:hypothetical protein
LCKRRGSLCVNFASMNWAVHSPELSVAAKFRDSAVLFISETKLQRTVSALLVMRCLRWVRPSIGNALFALVILVGGDTPPMLFTKSQRAIQKPSLPNYHVCEIGNCQAICLRKTTFSLNVGKFYC